MISYTRYLAEIDEGRSVNVPAPELGKRYLTGPALCLGQLTAVTRDTECATMEGRSAITMKKLRVTRDVAALRAGRVKLHNPRGYTPADEEEDGDWGQAGRSGPLWLENLFVR